MHPNPEKRLQLKFRKRFTGENGPPASALWAVVHAGGLSLGEASPHDRVAAGWGTYPSAPSSFLAPAHSIPQLAPEWIQNSACRSLPSVYICSRKNEKLLLTHHYQNLYLIRQGNRKWPIQTDMQSKQSCSYFPAAILSDTNSMSQKNNDLKHLSKLLPTTSVSSDCKRYLSFSVSGKTSIVCSLKTSGGKDQALTFPL